MQDATLVAVCLKIQSDHNKCDALEHSVPGGLPSNSVMGEIYELATAIRANIVRAIRLQAETLAECLAKASVAVTLDHDGLAMSAAKDLIQVMVSLTTIKDAA